MLSFRLSRVMLPVLLFLTALLSQQIRQASDLAIRTNPHTSVYLSVRFGHSKRLKSSAWAGWKVTRKNILKNPNVVWTENDTNPPPPIFALNFFFPKCMHSWSCWTKNSFFATLLIKAMIKCYHRAQRSPSILVTFFATFGSKGM